jgi:4-aminobutyrate aminotransferase-like enzyme
LTPGMNDGQSEERLARRLRLLGPAYRLFYREPLHLVRGSGVWLYDSTGRAYLDVYNNVAAVGHCHPEVVAALSRQAGVLNTHTRYLHDAVLDYAERLLDTFPAPLSHVMFTCTGSEANDLAVRIAKEHTGATGFIVTSFAYHGGTDAVAALSPSLGSGVPTGPHVRTVPPPDSYRVTGDVGGRFADAVRAAVLDLANHGHRTAGLIVDTVFSSDGVHTHPQDSLRAGVEAVRAAGGLFIADEVQAGFGRTGERFWGFQRHGLVPDLVSLGKPMGNGHPVAALVSSPRLLARFGAASRYFNTFGGNPVSAAVALTVLDIIERELLQERAGRVGTRLLRGLHALARRHEWIGDIRGSGLFIGAELVTDRARKSPASAAAAAVVNNLRDRGVLISTCGPSGNILKIRPPLVFEESHADQFLDALDASLGSITRSQ